MLSRGIVLGLLLFAVLVVGMFVFAYLFSQ